MQETGAYFANISYDNKEGLLLFSHEADILRKLRFIEKQKAELAVDGGQVYKAIADNKVEEIYGALATVIIS